MPVTRSGGAFSGILFQKFFSKILFQGFFLLFLIQLQNLTAVRIVHTDRQTAHNHQVLLIVQCEEGQSAGVVVYADNMLVVREDVQLLRVVAADRKDELVVEQAVVLISLVHGNAVVACVGAEHVAAVVRETECTGSVDGFTLLWKRGNQLLELELRFIRIRDVVVDGDIVLQLGDHVHVAAVLRELEIAGAGVELAVDDVNQVQFAVIVVKLVDLDIIYAVVNHADEVLIRGELGAGDVRTEVALGNAAVAAVEHFGNDGADTAVFAQAQNGHFTIVVTGSYEELVRLVHSQVAGTHAADRGNIDQLQIAVGKDAERCDAFVNDAVEETAVVGKRDIGRVVYFNFLTLGEVALFYIHIENTDSFTLSIESIGTNICYIFF